MGVEVFLNCPDCQRHFATIPKPKPINANGKPYISKETAELWLWAAHNDVNLRVRDLEQHFGDGDPFKPKLLIPAHEDCPNCARRDFSNATFAHHFTTDTLASFLETENRTNTNTSLIQRAPPPPGFVPIVNQNSMTLAEYNN